MTDFKLSESLNTNKRYVRSIRIDRMNQYQLKVWVERQGIWNNTFIGFIDMEEKTYLPSMARDVHYVEFNRYIEKHLRTIITMYKLAGSSSIRIVNND